MGLDDKLNEYENRRKSVKKYAKYNHVPLWMLAADMGVNDGNLSRKLRMLSEEKEKEMLSRIDRLSKEVSNE